MIVSEYLDKKIILYFKPLAFRMLLSKLFLVNASNVKDAMSELLEAELHLSTAHETKKSSG